MYFDDCKTETTQELNQELITTRYILDLFLSLEFSAYARPPISLGSLYIKAVRVSPGTKMKYFCFLVSALLFTLARATDETLAFVTALLADAEDNRNDYIGLLFNPSVQIPSTLLGIYNEAMTYTDDSYTSLINSDFPFSELSTFATGLPWYSTRLSAELAAATQGSSIASKTAGSTSGSTPSSTVASATPSETSGANVAKPSRKLTIAPLLILVGLLAAGVAF